MMRTFRNPAVALAMLLCTSGLFVSRAAVAADEEGGGTDGKLVEASLLADADAIAPGGTVTLGVRLKMTPHWHTYWANPGETGEPTVIKLTGPAGVEFGAVQWPLPTRIDAPGGISFGYEDEVLLMVPVTLPAATKPGGKAAITADVSWLVCKEECVQGKAKLSIELPVSESPGGPANQELFATWKARLPLSLADAKKGGAVEAIEQVGAAKGKPASEVSVAWAAEAPPKVEWFPVATRAVAIDDVKMQTSERGTTIRFKPTIYKPDAVPGGRVDSVLVFEDAGGRRVGVSVPITVPVPAAE